MPLQHSPSIEPTKAVLLAVPAPERQHRLTVAFRLVLLIPHAIALGVLELGVAVLYVPCWLIALITGSLPHWAAAYLAAVARWHARVGGYALLLTGRYPPSGLGDPAYPVRAEVAWGRVSRLRVLFRPILAIPGYIIAGVVTAGLPLPLFAGWLTALVLGRLPRPLHLAFAAALRYQLRYYAFAVMLTDLYPRWLYGDPVGEAAQDNGQGTVLALGRGARALLTLAIVLGVLPWLAVQHLPAELMYVPGNPEARTDAALFQQLSDEISSAEDPGVPYCDEADNACFPQASQDAKDSSADWVRLASQLGSVPMPSPALTRERGVLQADMRRVSNDLAVLAVAAAGQVGATSPDSPESQPPVPGMLPVSVDSQMSYQTSVSTVNIDEDPVNSDIEDIATRLIDLEYS